MKTIWRDTDTNLLFSRLDKLQPTAERQWGRMNAAQAVSHLNDSMKGILGDRRPPERPLTFKKRVVRFIGFTLPFPWPRGKVRTSRENDQLIGGTPPGVFSDDVAQLKSLVQRIRQSRGEGLPRHYTWGDLTPSVLGRYVYRHIDHHLKQFGC